MALANNTVLIPGEVIVYDDANGGVAIDYSSVLIRIANALESIASNSAIIASNSAIIASNSNQIIQQLQSISSNSASISLNLAEINNIQSAIKSLAEGPGFRISEPWGWLSMSSIVKLAAEKGDDLQGIRSQMNSIEKF